MCGICGVVSLRGALDPSLGAAIPAMAHTLRHRGPDDAGEFQCPRGALGHRRLAIIDRSGGHQPLSNEDGSRWIAFNGEVYNHHSLRRLLEARGHVFRTHSDTEAILHAYEEWGPAGVERLEGQFAFAILDVRSGELFLARDRLGKKPLFWAVFGDALHFASEIKALRESPAWNGEIDEAALETFLALGYIPAPASIYQAVRKLPPAHWLRLVDGRIETRSYWDVTEFDVDERPAEKIAEELDGLLKDVVKERLESEVPLGAFLSGGIDSGLVVSYLRDTSPSAPTTVSVGFDDPRHDELDAAGRVAARYATRHHSIVLEPRLDEVLDRIVGSFDEPFADSSAVPTFFVCGAARQHVTVCLSGDGGDEAFGGYDFRYVPHALEARLRPLVPGRLGAAALRGLGRAWPRSPAIPRALRAGALLENLGRAPEDAFFVDLCFLKPRDVGRLLARPEPRDPRATAAYEAVAAPYRRCPSPSALQRAQYADVKVYLPEDVLVKVDRMSMAHGLEVRCPLLDRRVIEFAFRVPTATKLPALRSKHLLRLLAAQRLPAENLSLPKHGFTAPVGTWITREYAERFSNDVLESSSPLADLVDRSVLRRWLEDHRAGRADRSWILWAAWMLARWKSTENQRSPIPAPAAALP
ncbi:MAG: asparagine synthase (glutamine-hydrolyzing) [bacterium]